MNQDRQDGSVDTAAGNLMRPAVDKYFGTPKGVWALDVDVRIWGNSEDQQTVLHIKQYVSTLTASVGQPFLISAPRGQIKATTF